MSSKEQAHSDDKVTAKPRSLRPDVQNSKTSTQQTHLATILRGAKIAPGSLTPHDMLQLQRMVGNDALTRLLAETVPHQPDNAGDKPTKSPLSVQESGQRMWVNRAKQKPKDEVAAQPQRHRGIIVQSLKYKERELDIDKLTYEEMIEIFDMMRKKESEELKEGAKSAYPIEYTAREYIRIKDKIWLEERFEPKLKEISCFEGEAKRARPDQRVNFGPVTSCMTITITLDDNSKIVAHDAVKCRTEDGNALTTLSKMLKAVPNKAKKIRAYGVGGSWTVDLQTQEEIGDAEKFRQQRINHGENDKQFKEKLKGTFGCSDVTYEDMEGKIKLESTGELYGNDIYDTVLKIVEASGYYIEYPELIKQTKQKLPDAREIEEKILYILHVRTPHMRAAVSGTPDRPAR